MPPYLPESRSFMLADVPSAFHHTTFRSFSAGLLAKVMCTVIAVPLASAAEQTIRCGCSDSCVRCCIDANALPLEEVVPMGGSLKFAEKFVEL